jgi:hypothetical protein
MIEELAAEVARLDRASKTADEHLKQAKEKLIAAMDEVDTTKVKTTSGRVTITLVNNERLNIDWVSLNEIDSETASKVRVEKADTSLFRAALAAGLIDMDLAARVSSVSQFRQMRVTRK